ncbi:hypothetical protein WKI13_15550 [Teredinibacter turnerae]|uniref:hypothetical protein n=1 Tax=Teredinibacter turnerae TaxID=2426 RepID=UPI0003730528|nr:hypothetical protein [Teredinibacter turnerae]
MRRHGDKRQPIFRTPTKVAATLSLIDAYGEKIDKKAVFLTWHIGCNFPNVILCWPISVTARIIAAVTSMVIGDLRNRRNKHAFSY